MKSKSPSRSPRKEVTIKEILEQLKDICPPGSFRWQAAECGVLQTGRKETIAGRTTWFFPAGSAEALRQHIEAKRAARKAVQNGKQA